MTKKIVLVIGGAGFIGSHVNKLMHQANFDTIVLDNLSQGHREASIHGKFIEGDMSDSRLLDKIFIENNIDAVMHFAAFTDVGESVKEPLKYYQNNFSNTLELLKSMIRHDVKKIIFSSTAAIFGIPQQKFIKEDHICNPINPYGRSKLEVEHVLHDLDKAYGFRYSCLRYFNAAGGDPEGEIKYYKHKESNLIPKVLKSLLKGDATATIYGVDYPTLDGTCIRDYIHIEDLGQAHILAMEQLLKGADSCVYNLGNGSGYSVREVLAAIEKVTGRKLQIIEGDRREGDPAILVADSTKARQQLGWKPQYADLESMIKHSWNAMVSISSI